MVEWERFSGGGVGDTGRNTAEKVSHGALAATENGGEVLGVLQGREVDVGGGGGLGEAVTFEGADAEFFLKGVGKGFGKLLGTGNHNFEWSELFGFDASEIASQESGGGEEEGNLVIVNELGESFGFQGGRVGHEVEPLDDRIPEGGGAAKGVEEGEAPKDFGVVRQANATGELADVAQQVAVRKGDPLWLA